MLNCCNCICVCIRVDDKCMLTFDTCMGCECWEGLELRMSVCVKWISFVHIKLNSFALNLRLPYPILSIECMDLCFEQTSTSIASRRACRLSVPQRNDRFGVTERLQPHRTTARHIFRRMSLAIESDILNLSGPLTPSLSPSKNPSTYLSTTLASLSLIVPPLFRLFCGISYLKSKSPYHPHIAGQFHPLPASSPPKARVPKAHFLPPLG